MTSTQCEEDRPLACLLARKQTAGARDHASKTYAVGGARGEFGPSHLCVAKRVDRGMNDSTAIDSTATGVVAGAI